MPRAHGASDRTASCADLAPTSDASPFDYEQGVCIQVHGVTIGGRQTTSIKTPYTAPQTGALGLTAISAKVRCF